jgi:N-acetylneuraminic acid mutarotase
MAPVKPVSAAAGDFWMPKAAMPTARAYFQVGVVNGRIYAIGGHDNVSDLKVNEEYDPKTDTWKTKAPMPTPRHNFALFVFQNKIHVIGGSLLSAEFTRAHEVYDPASDTWESRTPVSNKLGAIDGYEANVVNGKAYIISGSASLWPPWTNVDNNQAYDPLTDEWSYKAPIPNGVFQYASAAVDKKIYIIGGRDISIDKTYDLTQIYDVETNRWSLGARVPTGLSGAGGAVTSGIKAPERIYFIGGYTCLNGGGTFFSEDHDLNQIYDPERDEWTLGKPMPTSRNDFGLAVVDDVLYAIGGYDGTNYLSVNEQYTPLGHVSSDPSHDSTAPEIVISSPEHTTYYTTEIVLDFAVNESPIKIGYSLDGSYNVTLTGNTTLTSLSIGVHNVTVYAWDASGNAGVSETITFSVEMPFPTTLVVAASIATVAVISIGLLVYFRKRNHQAGSC